MLHPKVYNRPKTLAETYAYLRSPNSVALAGGALMLSGLELPFSVVVDVQDVAELNRIEHHTSAVFIGGGVSLQTLISQQIIPSELQLAITRTIPINQRYRLSVIEALIHPHAPIEWLAMLAVMSAKVEHTGFRKEGLGAQIDKIGVAEFVNTLQQLGFPYHGLILGLWIPKIAERQCLASAYVARTPSDVPIVNSAICVAFGPDDYVEQATLALGGVGQDPLYVAELTALYGQTLTADHIVRATDYLTHYLQPIDDYRGSAEYRRQMGLVIARRALMACL